MKQAASAHRGINGYPAANFISSNFGYFSTVAGLLAGGTSTATFFLLLSQSEPNTAYFGAPCAGWGSDGQDYWGYTDGGIYTG